MGAYVYKTTPTATARIVMEDAATGERRMVDVQLYEFAFKCYRMEEDAKTWARKCGPAERAFEKRGTKPLAAGISVYKGECSIGDPVFPTRGYVAAVEISDVKAIGKIVAVISSRQPLRARAPQSWLAASKPATPVAVAPIVAPQPKLDEVKPAAAMPLLNWSL